MDENFSGKTFVVTGTTSGIGYAIVEDLVCQGASVIGIGRSPQRCREAERRLRAIDPHARVTCLTADLSLQSQVRMLSDQIHTYLASEETAHLDGLVNNAGTFTYWLALTQEGFEMQWAVNHLAPFLLTQALLPLLRAAPTASVITVSSASHYGARLNWDDIQLRRRYNGLRAYGQTKLANVLFTLELNRQLGPASSIRAYAADPGLVKTEIGFKQTPPLVRWIWRLRSDSGVSPKQSAQGIVALLRQSRQHSPGAVYWKNGAPKQPSQRALNAADARRLWVLSAQMCGIEAENTWERQHV